MSYHAPSKLSLNTEFSEQLQRGEATTSTPGRRRAPSSITSPYTPFTSNSSGTSSAFPLSSFPQEPGNLPLFPIDSDSIPSILDSSFDEKPSAMFKVPGQQVFFVPYNSSPMGSHPAWTASAPSPTYQPFPESNYYPGQPRQYFEDVNGGSRHQAYVVPQSGGELYNDDDMLRAYASDSDKRSRRLSRASFPDLINSGAFIQSRPYSEKRQGFRPPLSVSPANSSATDDSGRSSSYGSAGSNRSVRWTEDLIAPTPPPSKPRPKGWFNRRGDQLWCNDGRYKAAIQEYPHYLRDYPDVGEGWMNEHGIRISMTHRRMPEHCARPPKGVLKNNFSPLTF